MTGPARPSGSFAAAFPFCRDAVEAAINAQRRLHEASWTVGVTPKVRMGVHTGTAFERDENYFGPSVNRAARLMSCAHGGQVVISHEALATLDEQPPGVEFVALGAARNPVDPRSFDFDLLHAHTPDRRGRGVNQFEQQYWRANIDPNER